MALTFRVLNELGFEVWFWKGCGLDQCFPSVFGIGAKFPRQKSDSISPYFCGDNPVAFCLRCVIAHKTLFSPSFCCEKMPYFHEKNLAKFCVWCAMVHRQGFVPIYTACVSVFILRQNTNACCIHRETNVTI